MSALRTRILAALILLALIDAVMPLPFLGLLLIYVVVSRPAWFQNLVHDVYRLD